MGHFSQKGDFLRRFFRIHVQKAAKKQLAGNTILKCGNTIGNTNTIFWAIPSSSVQFQMSPNQLRCSTFC